MSLTPSGTFLSDTSGSQESIGLLSVNATIQNASYGGAASNVTIASDGKSLTFNVLKKQNQLIVYLISPAAEPPPALYQNGQVLLYISLAGNTTQGFVGVGALSIIGQ